MDCRDAYEVCQADTDCPILCVKFFAELCPKVRGNTNEHIRTKTVLHLARARS
jgi:hypothetical protein